MNFMKKFLNYLVVAIPVIAIVLMSLSNSLCLISRTGEGVDIPSYYSFFNIEALGRGCVFALPSAIITIILILLLVFSLFKKNNMLNIIEIGLSVLVLLLLILNSLMSTTVYGWVILSLFIIELILLIVNKFILTKVKDE